MKTWMWVPEAGPEIDGLPVFETFPPASSLEESDPGHTTSARSMVSLPSICLQNSPLFSRPGKQGCGLCAWVSALSVVLSELAQTFVEGVG